MSDRNRSNKILKGLLVVFHLLGLKALALISGLVTTSIADLRGPIVKVILF